jgi:hypothetical protein
MDCWYASIHFCGFKRPLSNTNLPALQCHWSDLPEKFMATLEDHAQADALVFQGIGFFDVGVAVLTGRWAMLVRHLVPVSERMAGMSEAELVELLKARVRPVSRTTDVKQQ